MKHILVVGSINADTFLDVARMPKEGETILASDSVVLPGGKGANQAAGCGLLSDTQQTKVHFIGSFGNDGHVPLLRSTMTNHHVDISESNNSDKPSGQAFIMLMPSGQNSIIIVGGANRSWPSTLSSSQISLLHQSSCILLQREVPESVNLLVSQAAATANVPVMMDMGGEDSPISKQLLELLFVLSANETELSRVTNLPTDTEEQVVAACRVVQQMGVKNVLVTLGERGSLLCLENGTIVRQEAVKVDHVVDTTGAGDCFRAGFAVAFTEGRDWQSCLKFGSASSALKIQKKGAMSVPLRSQTEECLQSLA